MRKLLIAILCCSLWNTSNGQAPTFDWAFATGGLYGTLYNGSMILDNLGNIYSVGHFNGGPVDFDPGSDVLNLTSVGETDIYITKFNASGNFIWAKRFGGTEKDEGAGIAVDGSGNVYFTGNFKGVVDFDPGTDVFNLTSNGSSDIFVCKLDPDGNFLWAKQMGGISDESGRAIAVDGSGDVYVTGEFQDTVDFYPGNGTSVLTSTGKTDIFICKLSTSGAFQWVKQIGSTEYDRGEALLIDNTSNIFLTGSFTGTVDFDPGAGVTELTSPSLTGASGFILKLNATGDFEWVTNLQNNISGNAVTTDITGNIYVGGGGPGIGIVKLSATGDITWDKFLPGFNCAARSIVVDVLGNVYTTGSFRGNVDFDPSEGTVIFDSGYGWDAYINKFDASGNYIWAYQLGGPTQRNYGTAMVLDASGSIYASGYFRSEIDFDPGPNTFNLKSEFNYNTYLLKWNQETAGIDDQTRGLEISVYPNPTKGNLSIEFKTLQKWVKVKVFSITGQLLMEKQFQDLINLPLEIRQPQGIYLLEVIDNYGQKRTTKLIKY
ncbi:SBBP repeat-containing protein [Gelidibacter gilvus]|uniref:T9SS type A sorting domain-containing protein n=1 Tax=Gelidibacter gilvus TaxID=59602 RepID=A0A4Q0XHF0_9FLAO|nr:SBBP repeat-containing protein [Gelidibacter gilvus]RXJ50189.1 T9SS type A sorting domain-containing protein [Gelidibacter gilvus]